jgi:MFS family permease
MCGFSFTVFLSAFMLLPTAPFRILDCGGSTAAAGLFLGFLTYASALSAPFTGALADRIGKRRVLVTCSLVIAAFSAAYGLSRGYLVPLILVGVHGLFWSGLLSASAAYMTDFIPAHRRAEGIGYWGLSTILAIAVAPALGLWLYRYGWGWLCTACGLLNLVMAAIALGLEETAVAASGGRLVSRDVVEWRVLALSLTLFLYSFGYGGITSFSALYAEALGVVPRGIYFTSFALAVLVTRPLAGRLADRVGHRPVFLGSLAVIVAGLALLSGMASKAGLVGSALVFGAGFGTAYPVFAAHVIHRVDAARRGAAFGSILAGFDTGIGTGSIVTGLLIERFGFRAAFAGAAGLALLAIPYFLVAEARFLSRATDPA